MKHTTIYNIDLDIEARAENIPKNHYEASVECFRKAGLLGEKHVIDNGIVLNWFDPKCRKIIEGKFELSYIPSSEETLREWIEKKKLTTSGYDSVGMEIVEHGSEIIDLLERTDPLAGLPMNVYFSLPGIESMELKTPCGIQKTHVHTTNGKMVRFWRPKGEAAVYDFDIIKSHLLDSYTKELIEDLRMSLNDGILARIKRIFKIPRRRQSADLCKRLIENPDSVSGVEVRKQIMEKSGWFG
jgi:hypothetical protein